jgi:hypothetical protein
LSVCLPRWVIFFIFPRANRAPQFTGIFLGDSSRHCGGPFVGTPCGVWTAVARAWVVTQRLSPSPSFPPSLPPTRTIQPCLCARGVCSVCAHYVCSVVGAFLALCVAHPSFVSKETEFGYAACPVWGGEENCGVCVGIAQRQRPLPPTRCSALTCSQSTGSCTSPVVWRGAGRRHGKDQFFKFSIFIKKRISAVAPAVREPPTPAPQLRTKCGVRFSYSHTKRTTHTRNRPHDTHHTPHTRDLHPTLVLPVAGGVTRLLLS